MNDFTINNVTSWYVKTLMKNSEVFDVIFFNDSLTNIKSSLYFLRSKNFCFNEAFLDYVFVYTMNIKYLQQSKLLYDKIPYLYFETLEHIV